MGLEMIIWLFSSWKLLYG